MRRAGAVGDEELRFAQLNTVVTYRRLLPSLFMEREEGCGAVMMDDDDDATWYCTMEEELGDIRGLSSERIRNAKQILYY